MSSGDQGANEGFSGTLHVMWGSLEFTCKFQRTFHSSIDRQTTQNTMGSIGADFRASGSFFRCCLTTYFILIDHLPTVVFFPYPLATIWRIDMLSLCKAIMQALFGGVYSTPDEPLSLNCPDCNKNAEIFFKIIISLLSVLQSQTHVLNNYYG